MNNLLTIKNLTKYYHTHDNEIKAIDDLSLNVKEKEILAIVGPSGCGKSTLLSILASLEKQSEGTIEFSNQEKNKIGYMLQNDALFPWLTILDNCLLGLKIEKNLTKENKEKVIHLLNTYGLKDFIYCYPNQLSGGMRQRVL